MSYDPPSTHRQRKLLRFFGRHEAGLTVQEAAILIDQIMSEPGSRDRWNRYKYLTQDFGRDSDSLLPFTEEALASVTVPEGWDGRIEVGAADARFVAEMILKIGPFDRPAPRIQFERHHFLFTGRFEFGSRADCRRAVEQRGGTVSDAKEPTLADNFLVVGSLGNAAWAHGNYGNKISAAVMLREKYGRPSIVSEDLWVSALDAAQQKGAT